MRLRTGLQASLAYVLLLAVVALGIPLAVEPENPGQRRGSLAGSGTGRSRRGHAPQTFSPRRAVANLGLVSGHRPWLCGGACSIVDAPGQGDRRQCRPRGDRGELLGPSRDLGLRCAGKPIQLQRPSRTLGEELLATAVPIIHNKLTIGATRVTQSVASVQAAVTRVELGLGLIGIVVLALGLADRRPDRPAGRAAAGPARAGGAPRRRRRPWRAGRHRGPHRAAFPG